MLAVKVAAKRTVVAHLHSDDPEAAAKSPLLAEALADRQQMVRGDTDHDRELA